MQLAIKSGVELVPLAIMGSREVLPKGRLLARPGRVLIRVGEPVASREYTSKQKQELAELMHERVAALLAGAASESGEAQSA